MTNIKHIGLIPDGTRRWAQHNNSDLFTAYEITMNNIINFVYYSIDYVNEISIYLLSKDNLQRTKSDLDPVIKAEYCLVNDLLPKICDKYSIKIVHAGTKQLLPSYFTNSLDELCRSTSSYNKLTINLLLAYDPIDEINYALANGVNQLSYSNLWVTTMVDLVIRTAGGSVYLSNFLPIQCGYSQVYLVEVLFNDFTKDNFMEIINLAKKEIILKGK